MDINFVKQRTFSHTVSKSGFQQSIVYNLHLPLPENSLGEDFVGHLFSQQNIPLFAYRASNGNFPSSNRKVENDLFTFVCNETNLSTSLFIDELMREKLTNFDNDLSNLPYEDVRHSIEPVLASAPSFEEQFQKLINKCSTQQLSNLIKEEAEMTEEMYSIVLARDIELNTLEKACEAYLIATTNQDANICGGHLRELSQLNTDIRVCFCFKICFKSIDKSNELHSTKVGSDFSCRMEELRQYQRNKYHSLVRTLSQNVEKSFTSKTCQFPTKKFSTNEQQHSTSLNYSQSPLFQQFSIKNIKSLKKSISFEEKISQLCINERGKSSVVGHKSESFSIYIGSQLKTRHNVRLLTCNCLSDLCFSQTFEEFSHNQNNEENEDILLNSERLHFLMNLYGRELSAAVLIVGRDPLWHIKQKTVFARLCEKSAELHFDSLEDQLKVIGEHICILLILLT
ncbi:hypothetical protein Mgra_00003135 [Meloidogyne graminicola]|uniref:Uncharacterized protein n=1 Tax=Meloidogyne graminicola TaxID=189291 RepID=A0A8S9ZWT0_9BILA|nr:hypothetical protein Mgra_00003135 [Meloidogyne graminicola]